MFSHQRQESHLPLSPNSTPTSSCCGGQGMKRLQEVPQYLHLIAIPILGFLAAVAVHAPTPAHPLAILAVCLAAIGIKVNGRQSKDTNLPHYHHHYLSSAHERTHSNSNSKARLVVSLLFATAYAFAADFTAATLLWSAPEDRSQPWTLGLNGWMLFGLGACLWIIGAILWIIEPLMWWIQWREQKKQQRVMLGMDDGYLPVVSQNGAEEEEEESLVIVWEEDSEDERNRRSMDAGNAHSKV
ncbi:hypothetical protein FRC16_005641 [Serendipita sp. 398]|nr:hypothetical protein FRC16_005641 [Serendipita sp. 398]